MDNSGTTKNSGGKLSAKSIWTNFVQKAKAAWAFGQKKYAGKSASEQYMIAGECVALANEVDAAIRKYMKNKVKPLDGF